jgi:hypothetical protein
LKNAELTMQEGCNSDRAIEVHAISAGFREAARPQRNDWRPGSAGFALDVRLEAATTATVLVR